MIWYDMIWYVIDHVHRIILDKFKIVFSYSWFQIIEDVPISLSDNIQDKTNNDGCIEVSQNNDNLIINCNMIWLWYDMIMIWYDMIWCDMICDRSCS